MSSKGKQHCSNCIGTLSIRSLLKRLSGSSWFVQRLYR